MKVPLPAGARGRRPIHAIAVATALSLAIAACVNVDMTTPVEKAIAAIDNAIMTINRSASEWQGIVRGLADQLPTEIQEDIRIEAQNLASRTIATAGIEFSCRADFLGARAVADLQRLRTWIKGGTEPPETEPMACGVTPPSIDLAQPPARWSIITIDGFDLDHRDSSGSLMGIELLGADGHVTQLPESAIGRSTHYMVTLNLGDVARSLVTDRIVKVRGRWNAAPVSTTEVVIQAWTATRITIPTAVGYTVVTPDRVGSGDADFDADNGNPMRTDVTASAVLDQRGVIMGTVTMHAKETNEDWTEVDGSRTVPLCTPPDGYRIVRFSPSTPAEEHHPIVTHGTIKWQTGPNLVATAFDVLGDEDGDEAGTRTSVTAWWSALAVVLEPTEPAWFSGGTEPTICK